MDELYDAWGNRLLAVLVPQGDAAALAWATAIHGEWKRAFFGLGYTVADLDAALDDYLAGDRTPAAKGNWEATPAVALLRAIKRLAAENRQSRTRKPALKDTFGVCELCGNSGIASVPHPKCVVHGEWVPSRWNRLGEPIFARCGMTCSCPIGERNGGGEKAPLSLRRYEEFHNPAWREHLAEREEAERAMIHADQVTAGLPNIRRIIAGIGAKV